METFTACKLTIIYCKQNSARMVAFYDVAQKNSCPPRMSPMENSLKRKHLFISRVRIGIIEPVHEKTNNLGFRPGLTQTRLYSHRIKLEA